MVRVASGIDAEGTCEVVPRDSAQDDQDDFSRKVFAVSDAGSLVDALNIKLGWLGRTLSSESCPEDARQLMCETVEVCVQLTRLLDGALGSCRHSANTTRRASNVEIGVLVDNAVRKVAPNAASTHVGVLTDLPKGIAAFVDSEPAGAALDDVLQHALCITPQGGVVYVSATVCGGHVVVALTSKETTSVVPQSRVQAKSAADDGAPRLAAPEILHRISAQLTAVGGYVDVEERPNGGTTVFLVVPATRVETLQLASGGTSLASDSASLRQIEPVPGQKRSEKMIVNSDRFGAIEVDVADVLKFPTGIIGFPKDCEFVLVRKPDSQIIGWLQSVQTSYLTLPVVSAHVLAPRFPDVPIEPYAERLGLGTEAEDLAVLVVLSAPPGQPATVNLMAPIIVNAATRVGAQALLEATRFTTRELFVIPPDTEGAAATSVSETAATAESRSATSAAE